MDTLITLDDLTNYVNKLKTTISFGYDVNQIFKIRTFTGTSSSAIKDQNTGLITINNISLSGYTPIGIIGHDLYMGGSSSSSSYSNISPYGKITYAYLTGTSNTKLTACVYHMQYDSSSYSYFFKADFQILFVKTDLLKDPAHILN